MSEILVTSYPTPDIDGTACSIAYAEFLNKTGEKAVGAPFGEPDEEAVFLVEELGVDLPDAEKEVEEISKVVLVDACNLDWVAEEIRSKEIIQMIDHREDNLTDEFQETDALIEMVGAAATLVAERFRKENVDISEKSAQLLYTAIKDNTVNFQANVTTERDREIVEWLEEQVEIDPDLVDEVFKIKSDTDRPLEKMVRDGYYNTEYTGKLVGAAQLEMKGAEEFIESNSEGIREVLKKLVEEDRLDYCFLTSADIDTGVNVFVAADDKTEKLFSSALNLNFKDNVARREDMLLRKEIMPELRKEIMTKNLKFAEPLPEKVLSGEKDTTWRINDEREITVNDRLSLQTTDGEEFARAKAKWVKMTTFGRLTKEDREGHESFESKEEMYETYGNYYDQEIGPETEVKIIKFELIQND